MNSGQQEEDKSTFSKNPTIADETDFKVDMLHEGYANALKTHSECILSILECIKNALKIVIKTY